MLYPFGQILKNLGDYFIFLGSDRRLHYLARIVNENFVQQLERYAANASRNPRKDLDISLLNYVILTTERFRGKAAHFHKPEKETMDGFDAVDYQINYQDKVALRQEILDSSGVPKGLKPLMEQTEIHE